MNVTYQQKLLCEGVVHDHEYTCALLLVTLQKTSLTRDHKEDALTSPPSQCMSYLEAFLSLLLLFNLECIRTTWIRGKASKAWRHRWPPVKEKCYRRNRWILQISILQPLSGVRDRDLAFLTLSDGWGLLGGDRIHLTKWRKGIFAKTLAHLVRKTVYRGS